MIIFNKLIRLWPETGTLDMIIIFPNLMVIFKFTQKNSSKSLCKI